jgi:hypothetical protein
MSEDYPELARGANNYITIQRERDGIISIIQFDDVARILYEQGTRNNGEIEGFIGGGTNSASALKLALEVFECRIVFFTDGTALIPIAELQRLQTMKTQIDVVGYGDVDEQVLGKLVTGGGQLSIRRTIHEISDVFCAIAASD